jgi:signal transduction histidine kinase
LADDGLGIGPDELPHIFERFYRADKARRRSGGVGLGLAIVRAVVEFYGGRLAVTSPGLGQGTTAEVWWPAPDDQTPSGEPV